MDIKNETFTGILDYNDITFTFVFDSKILKLIPPLNKSQEVRKWFMKSLDNGAYTLGEPFYIEETLIGLITENGKKVMFFPKYHSIGIKNFTLIIELDYYILFDRKVEKIGRVGFKCPEIDYIYPTADALGKMNLGDDGEIGIITKSFSDTISKKEKSIIDNKIISIYFDVSRSLSIEIRKQPISLTSMMFFEFQETDDYKFIINLYEIAKKFIQYLCYRKNIYFDSIELSCLNEKKLYEKFANLCIINDNEIIESYPLEKGKFINCKYLENSIGKIIKDISNNNIYLHHIPDTYEFGRCITAGRFVILTAAFEWEFKKNYPNGIVKRQSTIEAERNVSNIIEKLIHEKSGKTKSILKFLKGFISIDSLKAEIIQYGKDYKDISDIFGNYLYNINEEKFNYNDIGERLSKQRNAFAHGDIDKDFIDTSLLDAIYLERIIYIIQLKYYGVSTKNIKRSINDLFGCHLVID